MACTSDRAAHAWVADWKQHEMIGRICVHCGAREALHPKPIVHEASWSRFLRERHLLILAWRAEGQSFEHICSVLSMDPVQVELISMTPLDDKVNRYDP